MDIIPSINNDSAMTHGTFIAHALCMLHINGCQRPKLRVGTHHKVVTILGLGCTVLDTGVRRFREVEAKLETWRALGTAAATIVRRQALRTRMMHTYSKQN